MVVGVTGSAEDEKRLLDLRRMVKIAPESVRTADTASDGKLRATAVNGMPDWNKIPVMVSRSGVAHYRPRTSNTWKNDADLSFTVKSAYDAKNLYLKIDVKDEHYEQKAVGDGIWSGDCVQIGFDTLNLKTGNPNYIEIGLSAADRPTLWCWQHPRKTYVGDLTGKFTMKTRRYAAGHEYELTLPWEFLRPFSLNRGKLGFNVVVLDADGTGIENWMGITDGIAGGKDPALFEDLHLQSPEAALLQNNPAGEIDLLLNRNEVLGTEPFTFSAAVVATSAMLPGELTAEFDNGFKASRPLKAGLNMVDFTVPARALPAGIRQLTVSRMFKGTPAGKKSAEVAVLTAEHLNALAAEAEKLTAQLENKIAALQRKFKTEPSYLVSTAALARYFIHMVKTEVNRDAVYRAPALGAKRRMIKSDPNFKMFVFDRAWRNMRGVLARLNTACRQADAIAAGKAPLLSVPVTVKGERPVVSGGGFTLGGRELFLVGPNTWCFHFSQLPGMAKAGMNFFDVFARKGNAMIDQDEPFKIPETYDYQFNKRLVSTAEKNGMFFFSRFMMGNNHVNADKDFAAMVSESQNAFGINAFLKQSPNLVYVVTQGEGFKKEQDIAVLERDFQQALRTKFGSIERLNAAVGSKYAGFDAIRDADKNQNSALKYEFFLFESGRNVKQLKRFNDFKRNLWQLPLSTHFTILHLLPWDTYLNAADYEAVWGECDVIGWDGGINPVSRRWAMNWSVGETMICDMARSFYPDKPIANNETHTIPGSFGEVSDEFVYASTLLPYLHGRNAGVFWLWEIDWHSPWGSYHFTREGAYHALARAALDLRRLAPEIAAFRQSKSPVALLYSTSSIGDPDYIKTLIDVYEGCYFSGFPVKFVSERNVLADKHLDYRILVAPGASRVSDAVFRRIAAFAGLPGRQVLRFGSDVLAKDVHGKLVPARRTALNKMPEVKKVLPDEVFQVINKTLAANKLIPEARIVDQAGNPVFGLEYRTATAPDGKRLIYLLNLNRKPVTGKIAYPGGKFFDLVEQREYPAQFTLAPLEFRLLRCDAGK